DKRPPISGFSFVAVSFAIAAAINIPIAIVEQMLGARMVVGPSSLAVVAYTAIFPSVLAYLMFNRGVEIIGPTRAGAFMHLVPLFTAGLAIATADGYIAAIAAANGFTVATRDTGAFEAAGAAVINPWQA
ncbi:MAG: EamA family transporter, partial [Burkholderiaceae bacterium]